MSGEAAQPVGVTTTGPSTEAVPGQDDAGPAGRRTLTAAALAKRLGRQKRMVNRWAGEGCPHDASPFRGAIRFLFAEDEVREWLKAQGRSEEKGEAKKPAGEPLFGWVNNDTAGADAGSDSFEATLRTLVGSIKQVMSRRPPDTAGPLAVNQWAQAMSTLSKEARQLEATVAAIAIRDEKNVPRGRVREILAALAMLVVTQLDNLQPGVPRRYDELSGGAMPDSPEQLRGLLAAATRDAADTVREQVADAIAKAIAEMEDKA